MTGFILSWSNPLFCPSVADGRVQPCNQIKAETRNSTVIHKTDFSAVKKKKKTLFTGFHLIGNVVGWSLLEFYCSFTALLPPADDDGGHQSAVESIPFALSLISHYWKHLFLWRQTSAVDPSPSSVTDVRTSFFFWDADSLIFALWQQSRSHQVSFTVRR